MSRQSVRKYPRIPISVRVECTTGNEKFSTSASTLGGGGLFLKADHPLEVGSEVVVEFRPARHLHSIRAKARVCYSIPGQGVALEYTDISAEDRYLLLRLIHHKTVDRRRARRALLATQIQCEELLALALSRDVSQGGMFIETKEPLPVGSQLRLRFNLDDRGPVVNAVAEVTYEISKLGMGVQFIDISSIDRARIQDYVAQPNVPVESPPGLSSASQ